jgi:hypothetical protein
VDEQNKLNLPERSSGVHLADPAMKMRAPFPSPTAEPTASITTATAMVDLRHSVPDVLASTANLLKVNGWRAGADRPG